METSFFAELLFSDSPARPGNDRERNKDCEFHYSTSFRKFLCGIAKRLLFFFHSLQDNVPRRADGRSECGSYDRTENRPGRGPALREAISEQDANLRDYDTQKSLNKSFCGSNEPVGVRSFHSKSSFSFLRLRGPHSPSTVRLLKYWNSQRASRLFAPKMPSSSSFFP